MPEDKLAPPSIRGSAGLSNQASVVEAGNKGET
jgi:hypothetical protein